MSGSGVVCFGECMIELSRGPDGAVRVGHGGDTLNTAVYLARLGQPVSYMTAMGADAWSQSVVQAWQDEGVGVGLVARHPDRAAGIYGITTDARGERSFTYWRDQSAARAFFQLPGAEALLEQASGARLLYLSGITLAIFCPDERARIVRLAEEVRARGGIVAFDPNWRPRLWASAQVFREALDQLAPAISIMLAGHDDEAAVWGDQSPEETAGRWQALGVDEVVVKHGSSGALVDGRWVRSTVVDVPVDTTGAGDSFAAGYLAARLDGLAPPAAAAHGARLARDVIRHSGAIIPRSAMPDLTTEAAS